MADRFAKSAATILPPESAPATEQPDAAGESPIPQPNGGIE